MRSNRAPQPDELEIIAYLAFKFSLPPPTNWQENLCVRDHDDGGMGSLDLVPLHKGHLGKVFGRAAAQIQFLDLDGVDVIAALYLDQDGDLFDLDVWKTDFNPLISYQDALLQIRSTPPPSPEGFSNY